MKKVIVFLAVIAIASVANAATWEITVNGNPHDGSDVLPSDIIGVTFVDPVAGFGGFGDFTANISAGAYVQDSLGFNAGPWVLAPAGTVTPVNGGFDLYAVASGFPSPAGDIMWFEFHVPELPESSDIVISHVLGSWNNVFSPGAVEDVALHVAPEPMTIGLLGLGALGLLRRRK
jgi:hypothetical protein